MKLKHARNLFLAAPLLLSSTAMAAGDGWITDMDKAMAQAKAEDKVILMDFTGTDWCHWCIKLSDEVFSQSMFKEYAAENLVLVELDFPRNKKLSAEQVAHNKKWADKAGIQGYPTIILADENGEEFARTGYRPNGPAPYVDHLNELRAGKTKRDQLLTEAASLRGLDKAHKLDAAMSIEGITVPNPLELMRQIVDLDSNNEAGLRAKYEEQLKARMAEKLLLDAQSEMGAGNFKAAAEKFRDLLDNYPVPEQAKGQVGMFAILAMSESGQNDEAITYGESLLKREDFSNIARAQVLIGMSSPLASQGKLEEAIAMFDRAIALDEGSPFSKQLQGQRGDFVRQIKDQVNAAKDKSDKS